VNILVDSSIWIDYFRSGKKSELIHHLLEENIVVTNDLILAELIPSLFVKNFKSVISKLKFLKKLDLQINWNDIITTQTSCLQNGINGIGISDLIIAQNATQNKAPLYTLNGHFEKLSSLVKLELIL